MKFLSLLIVLVQSYSINLKALNPIYEIPSIGFQLEDNLPTPLFVDSQDYLNAPPVGVGAQNAWKIPGGDGSLVKVVDVETCYNERQEDLPQAFYVGNNPNCSNTDHGTAVWGIVAGLNNSLGIQGIAYNSLYGIHGFIEGDQGDVDAKYIKGITDAILGSLSKLEAGDVLIIEQHMYGPDQYLSPVEYWDEIFNVLKKVTEKGVHCIEASGNGHSNLDDPRYGGAFDLNHRDSGCILVGAASKDKIPMNFTNFGTRVDVFGYGTGVTTTGYGNLFNGGTNRLYTSTFNGTSSASPIVAGSVALLSSIAKKQGKIISPLEMRTALRMTGIPQSSKLSIHIGNFPNIDQALKYLNLVN